MKGSRTAAAYVLAAVMVSGCGGGEQEVGGSGAATDQSPTTQAAQTGDAAAGGSVESAAGLQYQVPQGWQSVEPGSSMRAAVYSIPGDGELVLYFFGEGQGGGTEANIDRWVGQMEAEGGGPATEGVERGTRTVGPFQVTTVTVNGTYTASMMPGMAGDTRNPDYRLWGAVIEGEGGPWFFKAVGPRQVISEAEDELDQMLASLGRPS